MVEESKGRESAVGLPPGTLRYIGPQKTFRPRAELVHYSEGKATVLGQKRAEGEGEGHLAALCTRPARSPWPPRDHSTNLSRI